VLVHSPLVGPVTWAQVADELRSQGLDVVVPQLAQDDAREEPLWWQHARSAAAAIGGGPAGQRPVLVGHSGAGPLLPAIGREIGRAVGGYVFVDAILPSDDKPRLEAGPFGDYLRELYASGGRYPDWTEEMLGDIPDPGVRRQLVAEVRPQPWRYWTEPIPVFAGWPDAPCAYVRFKPNEAYDAAAAEALRRGWPCLEMAGSHFQMLVAPAEVASTVLDAIRRSA
jgi:hypothetical protein